MFAAVADCMRRGDVQEAASQLSAARMAGALSMDQDLRLADQLGWLMAQDRTLAADAVRAAADRLGWLAGATGPWARPLRTRLDAEQWLASLRRDAASRWWRGGVSKAVAARILLGKGRLRTLPAMGRDPTLRRCYGEFLLHAAIVAERFDPVRIASVERLLTSGRGGTVMTVLGALLFAGAMGKAAGAAVPGFEDAVAGATATGLLLLFCLAQGVARAVTRLRRRRRRR